MDHIGIEVHKKESQLCILGAAGELSERRAMKHATVWVQASPGADWLPVPARVQVPCVH